MPRAFSENPKFQHSLSDTKEKTNFTIEHVLENLTTFEAFSTGTLPSSPPVWLANLEASED